MIRPALQMLRFEPRATVFFGVLAQSSIGTGAGYIALLLVAYDRFESPVAISLVLAADLLPAMALGPIFGAIADRFSRRSCLVVADLVRAAAFLGIALVDGFAATVVLAVVAGVGTGLFTPAALASLPSLVARQRLPAATAVYGAIADLGFTVGPAVAAGILLLGGSETILFANAITFAISAVVLGRLHFGALEHSPASTGRLALLREARAGLVATVGFVGLRTVLVATAAALFFAGIFNVGELLFVQGELGASGAGFSAVVALFGLGFMGGSLAGSRGGPLALLKRRYLAGLAVTGAGFLAAAVAPTVAAAGAAFAIAGFGNGLLLVYERLIIQAIVPDHLAGRVFGVKDALTAWAFGTAFAVAAGLIEIAGVRVAIALAGAGGLITWLAAAALLRGTWVGRRDEAGSGGDADSTRDGLAGEDGADVVGGRSRWLALLDDLDEGADDSRVELGPRVNP
jgi:hypothetical protein